MASSIVPVKTRSLRSWPSLTPAIRQPCRQLEVAALELPCREAADVDMVRVQAGIIAVSGELNLEFDLVARRPAHYKSRNQRRRLALPMCGLGGGWGASRLGSLRGLSRAGCTRQSSGRPPLSRGESCKMPEVPTAGCRHTHGPSIQSTKRQTGHFGFVADRSRGFALRHPSASAACRKCAPTRLKGGGGEHSQHECPAAEIAPSGVPGTMT